jgi:hypothetical protein
MKLSGVLDVGAIVITAGNDAAAPRVWIRHGKTRLSLTEQEAVTIASQLADAVAELRANQSTTGTTERTPQ